MEPHRRRGAPLARRADRRGRGARSRRHAGHRLGAHLRETLTEARPRASGTEARPRAAWPRRLAAIAGRLVAVLVLVTPAAAQERLALPDALRGYEPELLLLRASPDPPGLDLGRVEALCFALEEHFAQLAADNVPARPDPTRRILALALLRGGLLRARHAEEPEEALFWIDRAFLGASELGLPQARAQVALARALQLRAAGRGADARAELELALSDLAVLDPLRPSLLRELGELQRSRGEYAAALAALEEAAAHPGLADPRNTVTRLQVAGSRAQVFLELGLAVDALAPLEDEERLARELVASDPSFAPYLGDARLHRVNLALVQADFARAAREARAALGEDELAGLAGHRAQLRVLLAMAYLHGEARDLTAALSELERALASAELPPRAAVEARLIAAYARLERGDLEPAGAELARVRAQLDGWRARDPDRALRPEDTELAAFEVQLALARGADRDELTRLRARLAAAFEGFLALWRATPVRPGGVAFLLKWRRANLVSALVRLEHALDGDAGAEHAYGELVRAQALGSLVRQLAPEPAAAASFAAARTRLLGPRHGALHVFPARDRTHLFAFDDQRFVYAVLPPAGELEPLRADYLSAVLAPPFAGSAASQRRRAGRERALAGRLAELLFPTDVRALLAEWDAVTILAQDDLGELPFACLPLDDEPYLGCVRALDHLSSLPLGVSLGRRAAARASPARLDLRLVAAPLPAAATHARWDDLDELTWSVADERTLTAAYGAGRAEVLVGVDATAARVLAELGAVDVLELLVHGVQDWDARIPASLVLTPEVRDGQDTGLLGYERIVAAGVAPRIVVLAACRAGLGTPRPGDSGVARLGAAWTLAGADVVLQSIATLDLAPAVELTAGFHLGLADGASPAEAARRARARLVEEGELAAPFFHGLLEVHGLGQVPLPTARGPGSSR